MTADYEDFATPQAHASAIAATGAPLLTLPSKMLDTGITTLAAGAQSVVLTAFPLNQLGYEVYLQLQESVAGTAGLLAIEMNWIESSTGLRVGHERWSILPGTPGNDHQVIGTGPTKGDALTVVVTNNDSVGVRYRLIMLQNSRLYPADFWRTDALPGFTGYNVTDGDIPSGLIGHLSQLLAAAGGSFTAALPLYGGPVKIHCDTGSAAGDGEAAIFNLAADPGTPIYDAFTAVSPSGNLNDGLVLPRSQCTITLTNHNAAAKTLRVWVVAG